MKRLKFTRQFRIRLSDKIMDLGNLVAAALVISQFVNGKEFSLSVLLLGLVITAICYIISYVISI